MEISLNKLYHIGRGIHWRLLNSLYHLFHWMKIHACLLSTMNMTFKYRSLAKQKHSYIHIHEFLSLLPLKILPQSFFALEYVVVNVPTSNGLKWVWVEKKCYKQFFNNGKWKYLYLWALLTKEKIRTLQHQRTWIYIKKTWGSNYDLSF